MIKTYDEILIKYAASFDDLVPIPDVPTFGELGTEKPKDSDRSTFLPEPLPVPETKKPISARDNDQDSQMGSPEWAAKNHTQAFLLGVKEPYRGFIRDPNNQSLVEKTMNKLVEETPENYFEWKLNRRHELLPWLHRAASNWIDKDPVSALMADIYKTEKLNNLQPKLWEKAMNALISASSTQEQPWAKLFPGHLFNKMRMLAGELAMNHSSFYLDRIAGKTITTKEFDETANRNYRLRIHEKLDEEEENTKIPQSGKWPKPKANKKK
jgi:hypothetical protein